MRERFFYFALGAGPIFLRIARRAVTFEKNLIGALADGRFQIFRRGGQRLCGGELGSGLLLGHRLFGHLGRAGSGNFSACVAGSADAGVSTPTIGAPLGLPFFLLRIEVVLGDFAFAIIGYSLQVPR